MHHIAIGTQDVQELSGFYRKLPGVSFLRENRTDAGELRSVWFRIGAAVLMIEKDTVPRAPRALILDLAASGMSRDALRTISLNWTHSTDHTDYFTDPDGNTLGYSSYEFPEK